MLFCGTFGGKEYKAFCGKSVDCCLVGDVVGVVVRVQKDYLY